jgi:fatty acid desaturase
VFFEWGVALHDLEVENIVSGKRSLADNKPLYPGLIRKIRRQALKDYVLFPVLSGPFFLSTLAGNAVANLVRNIWAFNIIFCGHFPAGVESFSEEECYDENGEESRGHWYYRQILGSANITGGKLFHIMSGNLSHQIEHHLFPDIPARRYPELAPEIKEICERYGLEYNTGRLSKQLFSVARKIVKLALPTRSKPEPTPEHAAPVPQAA